MKRIYLVRHGQTNGNVAQYAHGREEKLNDTGHLQAAQLATRVQNIAIDALVVSDYLRAQQTIAPIAQMSNLTPDVQPCFGEFFKATSLTGVAKTDPELLKYRSERDAAVVDPDWRFEDGESHFALVQRLVQGRHFLEQHTASNILIVTHSYFLRYFIASILCNASEPSTELLAVANKITISNGGITMFTIDDTQQWKMVLCNDHAHFAE